MRLTAKALIVPLLLALGGAVGGALQANLLLGPTTPAGGGACPGAGPWVLCSSNTATASAVTSGAAVIDSSGADLILVGAVHDVTDTGGVITDSKGNGTYTKVPAGLGIDLFYVKPTTVGPSHTFNYVAGGANTLTFPAIISMAFKGSAPITYDIENSFAGINTDTTHTGGLIPSGDGYLIMIVAKSSPLPAPPACTFSLPAPYTIAQQVAGVFSVNFGGMTAYYPQPAQGLANPTITCTGGNPAAMIASFKGLATTGGGIGQPVQVQCSGCTSPAAAAAGTPPFTTIPQP